MARKTDGEKIDELERIVSTLVERVDNVRREMIDKERLAVIEERLGEFKKTVEESSRRNWSIWHSLIGGAIGAVLTIVVQLIVNYLKN